VATPPERLGSGAMSEPAWARRFRAIDPDFPVWSPTEPGTLAFVSNRGGSRQVWVHRPSDGTWDRLSDEQIGVDLPAWSLPDGRFAWWSDTTGNERGRLVTARPGEAPDPVVPELPEGWPTGLSFAGDRIAITIEVDGIYTTYVVDGGAAPRAIWSTTFPSGVGRTWPMTGGLSADGTLLCVSHAEHGDILHAALRVFDLETGTVRADLVDPGAAIMPDAWSPVPGDQRLAITSELGPFERPGVWDLSTGERRDLSVDLPGAVFPVEWWPDASALLVRHEFEGRAQLSRLDPESGALALIADPNGDIDEEDAAVRPDGSVWFKTCDAVHPPRVVSETGMEILPPDAEAPLGRAYASFTFEDPNGTRIHSFIATPGGDGPFPTVMSVHGGPEWHERDRYDPETQAFVDAGYAVILINYRGSTGYGVAFRRALIGNVCFTETEDIIACLDALEAEGVVDPERVFWSGWSWGGCLACFNAGVHPDRWRAMFAGIPAGDMVAAHWASAPELQAWDDAVYGGSPDEVPEAYRRSDPMTYVGNVKAPILVIAGENDTRCPPEGISPWVDAVRANGVPVEVELYPAGHHSNTVDAQIRHMGLILDFFARNGGPPVPT
jgi:dienelactone hydrolase